METHDLTKDSPEAATPQEDRQQWAKDFEETLALGQQFTNYMAKALDLARIEVLLAFQTLPKLMMLWLMMMPIILLTWCSFSLFVGWVVYSLSAQIGLSILVFFLLQVCLLFMCRWLYGQYRTRMTLPYTRAQVNDFIRSMNHEFDPSSEAKK
jgi:uncharacterized membrane protein YqjE